MPYSDEGDFSVVFFLLHVVQGETAPFLVTNEAIAFVSSPSPPLI